MRRLLVGIVSVSLVGAACSGDDTSSADTTAPPESSTSTSITTTTSTSTSTSTTTTPSSTSTTTSTTTSIPVPEPTVTTAVVPLPDHITEVQLPWWTADGEAIVVSARSTAFDGMQIIRIAPDGSGYTCLTCDIAPGEPPLMKPIAFDDGQRVLVRVGNQTPFTNGDHAVLECTPSVMQCDDAVLVPIVVPTDDAVVQAQREFRVAPGGTHVGVTQMRTNSRGEPVYVSAVAGLERRDDHYELVDARAVSHRGELKQFARDARSVFVSSFVEGPEAGNGDVLEIDLTTGEERRITWYPDYDEPVEPSPDGRWFTVGSARTAGLFEPIAQVRRPNFLGPAISPLALHLFLTHRDELLEPWLIDEAGEAAGETGLLLNPGSVESGWEGRMIPNWNPDGRRITFWEAADASTAGSADAGSRLMVATLDGLGDIGTAPAPDLPDLSWAPALDGYSPPAPELPTSRPGDAAGSIEVTVDDGDTLTISITYLGFSDDGQWVLDGTETISNTGGPTGSLTYTADIEVSGAHTGFLRAVDVDGSATGGFTGTIESEVDGHRVELVLG